MQSHPYKPTRHSLFLVLLVTVSLLASASVLHAQQEGTEKPAAPEKLTGPQPIPPSQISVKSEETNSAIRTLKDRPSPQPTIEDIAKETNDALKLYEEMLERTEESLGGNMSFREFEDLERRWRRAEVLVREWSSQIVRRARSIDRDLETLQNLRRSWQLTLDTADELGLQEAHIEVAKNAVASLGELENQFGERRAELSTLQGQITRATEMITEAVRQIDGARTDFQREISRFEAPPIWQLIIDPPPPTQHLEALRQMWVKSRADFEEFIQLYEKDLIVFGFFYVGLLLFFIYLRRRTGQLDDYRLKFEASLQALERPISSSLVVGLTFILVFFSKAPRIVDDIVVLIIFLPLFPILPTALLQRRKNAFVTLVVITILGRIADVLPFLTPLQRLVLLVMCVTALVTIARLSPETGIARFDSAAHWQRRAAATRSVAMIVLVIAIIANLIGDVTLAALLIGVFIMSIYLGILLHGLYLILEGALWVGLSTQFARQFRMVQRHEELVRNRLLVLFRVGFVVLWVIEVLNFLHIIDLVGGAVVAVLTTPARFGEVAISISDILAFIVTVWAAFWISKLLRFVFEEDVFPRLTLPRGVPQAISIAIHYVVLLFGFFLAVAATGIELSKFTILAGAFGVGVGFGLQNVVNNFVSGLILLAERPIMPGDTVQIGELAGEVKRIGMRSSTVRTWHGAEVIVPNGNLISNEVINWTLSDKQRRVDINVGVAYGTDPDTVVNILVEVGSNHPDVLKHPPPYALFLGFGDSSLNFELRIWTAHFDRFLRVKSEVTISVEKALKQAGITIPFPQRDVHLIPQDKKQSPVVSAKQARQREAGDKTESGVGEEDGSADASDLDA
ncbi:MAG: mechanosensitive ion channel [Candidatus Latescibacterota bacterium]|nr:MAG: mechanosensitive ion channel [Candidatus Latescibacterota bacterium]